MTAQDTLPLIEAQALVQTATRCYRTLMAHIHDLTHEESLIQPPFNHNCMNWVVGHIMQSRDKMLQLVDEPSVWTAEQIERYERESSPVVDNTDTVRFEQMRLDLQTTHERLIAKLGTMTGQELRATAKPVVKGISDWTIEQFLSFLLWHETYHVGQTDILRQVIGKNDKII
jgi:uncharacterized damage-inducible protein DinB